MNGVCIKVGDALLPPELTIAEAAALLGRQEYTVRRQCRQGVVPTMPGSGNGAAWRIPTARLLDDLGVAHEAVGVSLDGTLGRVS